MRLVSLSSSRGAFTDLNTAGNVQPLCVCVSELSLLQSNQEEIVFEVLVI